jgi:PIN domain nuclease of toxin-antitoxin system
MANTPLPRLVERQITKTGTEKFVSIVSAWEIMMKPKLGLTAADVEAGIAAMGSILLPIRFKHLAELSSLASCSDHRDPFDRMLIAQALAEDMSMVSSDTRFGDYKGLRLIWG